MWEDAGENASGRTAVEEKGGGGRALSEKGVEEVLRVTFEQGEKGNPDGR